MTMHIDNRYLRKTSGHTTRFQITGNNGSRKLRLLEPGYKIEAPGGSSHFRAVHLGPVFNEIPSSLMTALRKKCEFLSSDLHGFIRTVTANGAVRTVPRKLHREIGKCDTNQVTIQ